MTIALTATAQPATASVRLRFTGAGTLTRVERADANGTVAVRTLPGVLPWTYGASDLYLDDYEPAAGAVVYTAFTTTGTVTASVSLELQTPWLFVPLRPSYSVALKAVTDYGAQREGRTTVLEPLGREDDLVITRRMGKRRGQLKAYAGSYADAAAIVAACDRGEVLMYRQQEHPGMDMYFVADRAGIETLSIAGAGTLWGAAVEYLEVSRPAGNLAGALGWTFAALAASAPDFATLRRRYATFEDMRLDNRIPGQ